jgi:hypothetical protein
MLHVRSPKWHDFGSRDSCESNFSNTYVPGSNPKGKTLQEGDEHTNQQRRNDPLEVMNAAKKE